MTDLERLLPLPTSGVTHARYVDDMREIAQYSINIDGYLVRHDWLKDGQKMTAMGDPIPPQEIPNHSDKEIEAAITLRRIAALASRVRA